VTELDDDLAFAAALQRKLDGDPAAQAEIDELITRRASEWDGVMASVGPLSDSPTRVVQGPVLEHPIVRVRVDGSETTIVAPHLGSAAEAELEARYRRSLDRHRWDGSLPPKSI
jgi:hypothetical protein